jgi:DNA (cytosine-5)-methyltransferase 1
VKFSRIRLEKIRRLRLGAAPRVVDLFSGCGGLSLGFQAAGFELRGGLELDSLAAESHARNFFGSSAELFELHKAPTDITETSPEEFLDHLKIQDDLDGAIDVIVGGPPCQAYSIVGRAKLREVANDPEAYKNDDRGDLYRDYLEYVNALQPLAILIENVPEILRYGNSNVPELICDQLAALGYVSRYTIINSVHYGVPQLRDRMCLIALCEELDAEPLFPTPTHRFALPRGYKNLRDDVSRKWGGDGLFRSPHFVKPVDNPADGIPAVTAEEAIGDLPPIRSHLNGGSRRGARRFTRLTPYDNRRRLSSYARSMRNWNGFDNDVGIYDHVIRHLPRDYQIFERMNPGDEYPAAHKVAMTIFDERLRALARRGTAPKPGSAAYNELKKTIVPPYDPTKFANKWRKLDAREPSRTITAHIGKDSYSHIHYADDQARTISVREAARLQSFPDGFRFAGTLDPALKQIGNSVPPLFAAALAEAINQQLATHAIVTKRRA